MKKTLLIVDDEPGVRLLLEHYFAEDYNVVSKADGDDALSWLSEGNNPQLILTDIEMPHMNGLDLIKEVRARFSGTDIPCLVVSGKSREDYFLNSFKIGANGFVAKPFKAEELKREVDYLLTH